MRFDPKSLTVKMWTYFIVFTGIILVVLWCLQIIFINSFYKNMKIKQIVKAGNLISANFNREDIDSLVHEYTFKNNLFITVINEDNSILMTSDAFGVGAPMRALPENPGQKDIYISAPNSPPDPEFRSSIRIISDAESGAEMVAPGIRSPIAAGYVEGFDKFKQLLSENSGNPIYFIGKERNNSRIYYVSTAKNIEGEQLYLLITAPVPPLDSTVEILKNQLIIITGFLIILASVVAYLFARRLANPIVRLTGSAERLASGDFSVVFEHGGYSEINRLADTLNYATEELSRVDELRKDLIANISHDLRTPLTIVKFYGEMIHDVSGDNPEKRREHSQLIIKESDKLTSLVNEILDYSKIQSDNFELEMLEFNISKKVEEIVEGFKMLLEGDGYRFKTFITEGLLVTADELHIERVIYNLISNAVNYTGEDKTVQISLAVIGDTVRFEVSDTGPGIPADQHKNIWERYYKVKETHRRAVVGNGLGLSIVKNILERHNANFGVKSAVNEGSTFWFELPVNPGY